MQRCLPTEGWGKALKDFIDKNNRGCGFFAGILGIMTAVLVLICSFYVVTKTDHDCEGEDCPVCACIQACENVLRQADGCTPVMDAVMLPVLLFTVPFYFQADCFVQNTLISEKVRLND